jgi:hypothetical protein
MTRLSIINVYVLRREPKKAHDRQRYAIHLFFAQVMDLYLETQRTLPSDNHSGRSCQNGTHTPSPTSHFSRHTRSQSSTASRNQRGHSNKLRTDISCNIRPIRRIGNSSRSRRTQGRQQRSRRRRVERGSRRSLCISSRRCICRLACRSSREIANFVRLAEVICKANGSCLVLVREQ